MQLRENDCHLLGPSFFTYSDHIMDSLKLPSLLKTLELRDPTACHQTRFAIVNCVSCLKALSFLYPGPDFADSMFYTCDYQRRADNKETNQEMAFESQGQMDESRLLEIKVHLVLMKIS